MASQWDELFKKARAGVKEIDAATARQRMADDPQTRVLDVREKDEVDQGHLTGAIWIPRGFLELRAEKTFSDKEAPLIVYCAGGTRSVLAADALQQLGYKNVVSMAGGFGAWKSAGFPFTVPESADGKMSRYMRHFRIPEVGEAGQKKLLASKVLLIGAGGLGSPSALYLAAAGVGTMGLIDSDQVDYTNLQRQILHKTRNVGMPKVQSAQEMLYDINPDVKVKPYYTRLERGNAEDIIKGYDVVVDGSDNFATRYLVNDICVKYKIPNMYASIFRFEGLATVFLPYQGPCYRCVYPEPTPAHLAPTCEEAGVLGVLCGTMGIVQATECLKVLLGIGETLAGRLLQYDALEQSYRSFKVKRDPHCAACGEGADLDHLIATYDAGVACAIGSGANGQAKAAALQR
jgi:adenylyltransferase/sulfurtransferase